ncbi:hypothetical protein RHMOL_Rhmol05G0240200 [Rhododendron molle]|uniref:Uncharacterized protein n=1 Tax=Rhododendron molle TaxID=49168 RepID=A0ACC0NU40_RHOML|nr:hypothetical protein RHMOL_Rhmol05G0240200 [Rhododendron molle]
MNNRHHRTPPPGTILDLHTATQILQHTCSIFRSHLLKFLALSFLLLTFRSNVENGSHVLNDFIDRDPSLRALISRLNVSLKNNNHLHESSAAAVANQRRRQYRRRFLHLTLGGTLDDEEDDFFSGGEDGEFRARSESNGSSVILGNFDTRVIRTGLSFKLHEKTLQSGESKEEYDSKDELKEEKDADETERVVIFQFLLKDLALRQHEASALFFLGCLLSAAYGYVILGFLVTYSWVIGIVFVVVVNHFLGRTFRSWYLIIWDGSYLGLKRLSGFILMRWAIRDALTQLLGLWYFREIEDQYSFFRIFVRLKLVPFSIMSPWIRGFENETAGFLFAWLLLDTIVEFVFSVDPWVAIVDSRRSGREIVKEGCYLLLTMFKQAVVIKCLEYMLCGSLLRWTLAQYFGKMFTTAFQSIMEVFFMVAWLIFYFSVRSKDANSLGRTFGRRELEGFIQGHRR